MRILYIDMDTTRPDHLGCYGYHRNTSPHIDAIAAEGVRFENYYCSDAPCLPSRTALMTGRFGIHTGVVGHDKSAAELRHERTARAFRDSLHETALPTIFRRRGMKTCLISPFAERHSAWAFYAGFTEMHNTGKCGDESAEDITPTVLDWIDRHAASDDWYLHINYWDPHTVYRVPEDFGNPFENEPIPDWYTQELLDAHKAHAGPHSVQDINMYDDHVPEAFRARAVGRCDTLADLKKHIDGYDCGIAYMDRHIGMVFDALRKQGIMDDVVVILSADHGENQGEMGIYAEHGTADAVTCRIPMIIRWPGMQAGHVARGFHHNIDLAPTLAELLDVEPAPVWDGVSFAPTLRDGIDCGKPYLVIGQCAHVAQRGVRWDRWMYIRTYHDGFHPFPKEMLFDLEADPHELNNIADAHPEICRQAVYHLMEWHDEAMAKTPGIVDPLWQVIAEGGPCHASPDHLRGYIPRLEATGRAEAIPALKARHPDAFR